MANSMQAVRCLLLVVAVIAVSTARVFPAEHDPDLQAQLLREVFPAWKHSGEKSKNVQGSLQLDTTLTHRPGESITIKGTLRRNASCWSLSLGDYSSDGKGKFGAAADTLHLKNSLYAAILNRQSPDASWVLSEIHHLQSGPLPEKFTRRLADFEKATDAVPNFGSHIIHLGSRSTRIDELMSRPGFKIRKCYRRQSDGVDVVVVDFANDGSPEAELMAGGSLALCPERSWGMHSCAVNVRYPNGMAGVFSFQAKDWSQAGSGIFFPSNASGSFSFVGKDGKEGRTETRLKRDFSLPDPLPDDAEFRLTAYGLPEPPGVEWVKPTPWWIYVIGAALALLAVSVVFTWLKKRAAKS